ncbi:MAG: hypothetical protein HY268_20775 [Deltaproteobacteria bacterium]|nr:hypothetical protein [Deltaproteobacteria bacterium]
MTRWLLISLLTCGWILIGAGRSWAQGYDLGVATNLGNLGNFGLNPGTMGGGETMPGAVLVKFTGEIQCRDCTLEAMGLEETPGDLYQFSHDTTHLVIKVTSAAPDIAWEMVERHKLFLQPGEDAPYPGLRLSPRAQAPPGHAKPGCGRATTTCHTQAEPGHEKTRFFHITFSSLACQLCEQRPSLSQIRGIKPLGKPTINFRQ